MPGGRAGRRGGRRRPPSEGPPASWARGAGSLRAEEGRSPSYRRRDPAMMLPFEPFSLNQGPSRTMSSVMPKRGGPRLRARGGAGVGQTLSLPSSPLQVGHQARRPPAASAGGYGIARAGHRRLPRRRSGPTTSGPSAPSTASPGYGPGPSEPGWQTPPTTRRDRGRRPGRLRSGPSAGGRRRAGGAGGAGGRRQGRARRWRASSSNARIRHNAPRVEGRDGTTSWLTSQSTSTT